MIKGIGVDIINLSRIRRLLQKSYSKNFLKKVLSKEEQGMFEEFCLETQKVNFVSKRWAIKECIVKSLNLKDIIFNGIFINEDNSIIFHSVNKEKYRNIVNLSGLNFSLTFEAIPEHLIVYLVVR